MRLLLLRLLVSGRDASQSFDDVSRKRRDLWRSETEIENGGGLRGKSSVDGNLEEEESR